MSSMLGTTLLLPCDPCDHTVAKSGGRGLEISGQPVLDHRAMLSALEVEDLHLVHDRDPERLAGTARVVLDAGQRPVGRPADDEARRIIELAAKHLMRVACVQREWSSSQMLAEWVRVDRHS